MINPKWAFGMVILLGLWMTSRVPQFQGGSTSKETTRVEERKAPQAPTANSVLPEPPSVPNLSLPALQSVPVPRPEVGEEFRRIFVKTFKSDIETARVKEILSDSLYLQELSKFLSQPQSRVDKTTLEIQDSAVDVLIEALKGGDSTAAMSAISNVITDDQVENVQLPMSIRENLAGIKGELLYHASALQPQSFAHVESLLPGPVSRAIWQNVKIKQQQNLNESKAEQQSMMAAAPASE